MGYGSQSLHELEHQLQELVLGGGAGEGGAHQQVHLDDGQQRPEGGKLSAEKLVLGLVLAAERERGVI